MSSRRKMSLLLYSELIRMSIRRDTSAWNSNFSPVSRSWCTSLRLRGWARDVSDTPIRCTQLNCGAAGEALAAARVRWQRRCVRRAGWQPSRGFFLLCSQSRQRAPGSTVAAPAGGGQASAGLGGGIGRSTRCAEPAARRRGASEVPSPALRDRAAAADAPNEPQTSSAATSSQAAPRRGAMAHAAAAAPGNGRLKCCLAASRVSIGRSSGPRTSMAALLTRLIVPRRSVPARSGTSAFSISGDRARSCSLLPPRRAPVRRHARAVAFVAMSGTPGRAAAPPQPLGSPAAAAAAAGPAAQQPPWRAAANIAAAEAAGFVWTHVRGFSAWPSRAVPAAEVPRLITERQLPGRPAALADALVRRDARLRRACGAARTSAARCVRAPRWAGGAGLTSRKSAGRKTDAPARQLVQFFGTSEYSWVPRTNTQAWGAGISEGARKTSFPPWAPPCLRRYISARDSKAGGAR